MSVHTIVGFLDHHARAILVLLALFFLGIETSYAVNRPLSVDEFNGAWSVAQLATRTPYVDFEPYKPVLGYYVQLALLCLARDTWHGYLAVRLGMVYLTGTVLLLGALRLQRIFRPGAACLAFALMVVMTSLLEWAIEVRLDMLTALFGFVSLILLLNRRAGLAGTVAGLGFLTSQKGAMFALAGGIALLGCLVTHRDRRWVRDVLVYGVCVVLPISLYVLYWSLVASFAKVWGPTFAQATQLRAMTTPPCSRTNLYQMYWAETLTRNSFYYLCALWAMGSLLAMGGSRNPRQTMLLFYGGTVGVIMVSVRQPWPYSFVLLVPTVFVLLAEHFSRELERPASLLRQPVIWVAYGLFGLVLPLSELPIVTQSDTGPQRQAIKLTEALLGTEDRYFAGFQFLYRGDANTHSLSTVDLNSAPPIQSLTAAQVAEILERLQKEPIRVLLYTFKIDADVPTLIRKHLYRNYAPFWGNVWMYAPQVRPSDSEVNLLFTDVYSIEMDQPHPVLIDSQAYAPGATLALKRGRHTIATPARLRLKLRAAKVDHLLDPAYRKPVNFFWPSRGFISYPASTGRWVDN